jgi:hypothetical protein
MNKMPSNLQTLLLLLDQINETKKEIYKLEFLESGNVEYLEVAVENAALELSNLKQNLQWQKENN